jgi:hypothetical protein
MLSFLGDLLENRWFSGPETTNTQVRASGLPRPSSSAIFSLDLNKELEMPVSVG